MSKIKTNYTPRNDWEELGAEAFKLSPNKKMLSDLLEGNGMKDNILGIAEKSFIDGFVTAFKTVGHIVRSKNNE